MMKQLRGGHALASARQKAQRARCMKVAGARSGQRLASVLSLSIVWLLVSQNSCGLGGCEAAPRVRDLDGDQEQQQQELGFMRDQLPAHGQLERVPDPVRRLLSGTAFSRTKLPASQLMDPSCKKLIDNYRELLLLLLLRQQQQLAPTSRGLEASALERLALEQRAAAAEEARKLMQLVGPDYETADERLELDKKAGAKHTPRFG